MDYYGSTMSRLIDELARLPGIGRKSAQRLAFSIVKDKQENVEALASSILEARANVRWCKVCCTMTDGDVCPICGDPTRDRTTIMVVEDSRDMVAYEKTRGYKGLYHILQGVISPMAGTEPGDLRIRELLERLRDETVQEVILATNPTVEGETTALYIARLIKPLGLKVTRIANGVPVGGDLEYIDEVTLTRALEGRTDL